jgi:hypothetical protein
MGLFQIIFWNWGLLEILVVNSNLEQYVCQDLVARVARATVSETITGKWATTPIINYLLLVTL